MPKHWALSFGLVLLLLSLSLLGLSSSPDENFHIVACDVGQGDAILAFRGKYQILIDGGPDTKVLDCLGKYMPFWDREIEAVINTHPQADHYTGLIEVFKRYKVGLFLANGLDSGNKGYQVLKNEVGGKGIRVVNPSSGMSMRLGLIYIDILGPTSKTLQETTVNKTENKLGFYSSTLDPNSFSIVARLSYGDFDALTTGDIDPLRERLMIEEGRLKKVEYIKVPHHGSKNGLTADFLDILDPKVAVISVGKKNSYGHPNREIMDLLKNKNILIKRTDLDGSVEIVSDGRNWWVR